MQYTVNKLANLSGVTVRTLHHYDKIGLLKPSYVGDNNYRYYAEEQVLLLQQILFYRELGFSLADIQRMVASKDFDKIEALQSHRQALVGDLDRMNDLIKTIDKTIAHIKGEQMIKLEEIFEGFTDEKQHMYEDFLIDNGVDQQKIDRVWNKAKGWGKDKWLANKQQADQMYADLAQAIDRGLVPESDEVQQLIHLHYELTKVFWTPTRESYINMAKFYGSHPDFVEFYQSIHPKLLHYLQQAMEVYAQKKLS
ncbi:MAG: MerR family transcriptional regulator [Coxiellaceae bacterium]|nr:MerR family transcriptional regulator [Coxiellaceae bacterium]